MSGIPGELMLKQFLLAVCAAAVSMGAVEAQTTASPPAAREQATEKPAPPAKPAEPPQLVNVRIELTILDQTGPGEPSRKVVTMHVADRQSASIRTSGWVFTKEGRRDVSINVDARPAVLKGKEGSVQVELGLQYQPTGTAGSGPATDLTGASAGSTQTGLNERISAILESGKPLLISQAADPTSDRRISVEMKATILK
jgi:hypothetical protein